MPSTTTSNGAGSAAMRASASASPASGVAAPVYSGTKRAAAAEPCSKVVSTSFALERASLSGTQRSSTRVTVTLAQSSACFDNCAKKSFGVLPPETAITAVPRSAIASRNCAATRSASAVAWALQFVKLWVVTFDIARACLLVLVPGAPVALDQRHRGAWAPAAGGVLSRRLAAGGPGGEDGVGPAPCRLHLVAAHEQGGVAAHHVQQQALVGVGLRDAERLGEAHVQRHVAQAQTAGAGVLDGEPQLHALVRLQAQHQAVLRQRAGTGTEDRVRH